MVKNWIVVLVVGSLLVGCNIPQQEEAHYQKLTEVVVQIGEKQLEVMGEVVAIVKEKGLAEAEKIGKVEEAVEKIGENFDAWKPAALASAKKYDEMREEDSTIAIIEAVREGNRLIPSAYAPMIEGVLGLAVVLFGLKKKKEADTAKRNENMAVDVAMSNENALGEVVRGIEEFKRATSGENVIALKNKLRESTSPATKVLITENR